jgi:hypothetical protein
MELAVIALIAMFGLSGKHSDGKSRDQKLVVLLLAIVFMVMVMAPTTG